MKANGKQTRARTVSINTIEALCVKKACEECIERLESKGKANEGALITNEQVIEILETMIDKLDALPYFNVPTRNNGATKATRKGISLNPEVTA